MEVTRDLHITFVIEGTAVGFEGVVEPIEESNAAKNTTSKDNSTSEEELAAEDETVVMKNGDIKFRGVVFAKVDFDERMDDQEAKLILGKLDNYGNVNVTFTVPVFEPILFSDIDYSNIFRLSVEAATDGRRVYGGYQGRKVELRNDILDFKWEVSCFTKELICFDLTFERQELVSVYPLEKDLLIVEVLSTEYFFPAVRSKRFPNFAQFNAKIVPQVKKGSTMLTILASSAEITGVSVTIAGSSDLALTYMLGASKQQLWSMLNAMQTVIYSAMININFPVHTAFFFDQCFEFAKMDVFSAEEYFAEAGFIETPSYSDKLESAGFETMNFMINSGSFLVFLALTIAEFVFRKGITSLAVYFGSRSGICRKIGRAADGAKLMPNLIRLLMQTYIDVLICGILQMIWFSQT